MIRHYVAFVKFVSPIKNIRDNIFAISLINNVCCQMIPIEIFTYIFIYHCAFNIHYDCPNSLKRFEITCVFRKELYDVKMMKYHHDVIYRNGKWSVKRYKKKHDMYYPCQIKDMSCY